LNFKAASLRIVLLIIATLVWLAILEHNYHPRIYDYNGIATILQVGESELDFNHPPGIFTIWWQSERKNVRLWPLPFYETP